MNLSLHAVWIVPFVAGIFPIWMIWNEVNVLGADQETRNVSIYFKNAQELIKIQKLISHFVLSASSIHANISIVWTIDTETIIKWAWKTI